MLLQLNSPVKPPTDTRILRLDNRKVWKSGKYNTLSRLYGVFYLIMHGAGCSPGYCVNHLGNKRAHNGLNVFTVQKRVAGPVFPFFFRKLYCALRNGGARKASASFTLSLLEQYTGFYLTQWICVSFRPNLWLTPRYSSAHPLSNIHRFRPFAIHSSPSF